MILACLSQVFGGQLAVGWNRLTSAGTPGLSFTGSHPPGGWPQLAHVRQQIGKDSGIVRCL